MRCLFIQWPEYCGGKATSVKLRISLRSAGIAFGKSQLRCEKYSFSNHASHQTTVSTKKGEALPLPFWSYWPEYCGGKAASVKLRISLRSAGIAFGKSQLRCEKYSFSNHASHQATVSTKKGEALPLPFWSYWPDSNRRPADYESAALPAEPQ